MSESKRALVAIAVGSESDLPKVQPAADTLGELGIPFMMDICSAHRTPERAAALAKEARESGVKVIIAAAGGAAHLAGTLAAHTTLPVIGIPVSAGTLGGMDALLATVQMPGGVPVVTVAIDGAKNAALLAAQILALEDPDLGQRLTETRAALAQKVQAAGDRLNGRT